MMSRNLLHRSMELEFIFYTNKSTDDAVRIEIIYPMKSKIPGESL